MEITNQTSLLQLHPQEFITLLRKNNIRRFHFVSDPVLGIKTSHPLLQEIADYLQHGTNDFVAHEALFFQVNQQLDTLQGAFIHRTVRGQAAGGVRYMHYDTLISYLQDGLRLSKGMTYKNSLAGLWWGGGKGIIAHNPSIDKNDPQIRSALFQ